MKMAGGKGYKMKKEVLNALKKYINRYFSYYEIKETISHFGEVQIVQLTFGRWEVFINKKSIATIEEDDGLIIAIY